MGQHTALGLLEGEGPFLLYLAQYKSTHPLIPVAFRKPWSCSHLGNVGGGGGGECFRSGTEYAGEHLLASGAARDLWDTSSALRGHPVGATAQLPASQDLPAGMYPLSQAREGTDGKGKRQFSCAPNCTKGLEGQGEVSTGIPGWRGPLQWAEGLMAAFGSSLHTLRATLAQSSQAASASVHPTVHAKGWEGCTGTPAPVPALFFLQHKEMSLGQHLVFGPAGPLKMKGWSKKSLSRGRAVLSRMVGGHHLHWESGDFVGGLG